MAKFLFLTHRLYRKSKLKQSKNSKGTAVFVYSLKNFFFNRYFILTKLSHTDKKKISNIKGIIRTLQKQPPEMFYKKRCS